MNKDNQILFDQLMILVNNNEAFFYKDFECEDLIYRIFNYRLASYTDFLLPGALECRGIMFEIKNDKPVRLASRPMKKFFNLNENPLSTDIEFSQFSKFMDKADGSLISTYSHNGTIRLKTKGALYSDQALESMMWLDLPEQKELKRVLLEHVITDVTINMEWCSPTNRIVLSYDNPHLKVLNARCNITGTYLSVDFDPAIRPYLIKTEAVGSPKKFIESIPNMVNIEGYVIEYEPGEFVKVKTLAYLALHHSKDSLNSPRRLFEVVLEEASDDLRSLFHDDLVAMKLIEDMEKFVDKHFNHLVDTVERFYERNKHLERKEYAILCQSELPKAWLSLTMNKYLDREFSYKEFMKKRWKEYGLKDIEVNEND